MTVFISYIIHGPADKLDIDSYTFSKEEDSYFFYKDKRLVFVVPRSNVLSMQFKYDNVH